MFRFGKLLGAQQLGTSVYELSPGQSICPYHYEYGEEEWLLVLSGRPTLRHPEGTDELEAWDVVCFAPGPAGAHAIRNDTDENVRVLMYSTVTHPAATVYPDSDKIAIWTGNADDNVIVRRASGVDYWSGEPGTQEAGSRLCERPSRLIRGPHARTKCASKRGARVPRGRVGRTEPVRGRRTRWDAPRPHET